MAVVGRPWIKSASAKPSIRPLANLEIISIGASNGIYIVAVSLIDTLISLLIPEVLPVKWRATLMVSVILVE